MRNISDLSYTEQEELDILMAVSAGHPLVASCFICSAPTYKIRGGAINEGDVWQMQPDQKYVIMGLCQKHYEAPDYSLGLAELVMISRRGLN